ncbi:MAG: tetratricopeptide repeat protein, partial [Phycisphaerales bacterium]|nr:tetratricopeptide repeat protein [Phycisphaerales bacterium]
MSMHWESFIHEAARMVREEAPTRLSTIDRHLRGDVETITMKAMEKIRSHRYQSATELQQDIQKYLEDRPISASPPNALDNLRRFARRHRAASAAMASIFIILLGAVIGVSIFAIDADQQRNMAQQAQARAESVSGFVSTMLSSQDPVTMGNIDKALMQPVLAQATESMEREFEDEPLVKADLHRVIGQAYRNLGLYHDSQIHLEQALEIRLSMLGEAHPDTLDSLLDMAMQRSYERKPEEAAPYLEKVVSGRRLILGEDHPDTIDATLRYANCLSTLSEFKKSHELMATVMAHRKERLGDNHIDTLDAMASYGSLLLNESRYDESAVISHDVVKRMRSSLGSSDARTLASINNHAIILSILQRHDEAK